MHQQLMLSCDWGTSSFRLRLVELPTLKVVTETTSATGIAATQAAWLKSGGSPATRFAFFRQVIQNNLQTLQQQTGQHLNSVPLVLSGMVSATIGMLNLGYKHLPFATDGRNLAVHHIKADETFAHEMLIVSGVRSAKDVMRGEEIQLVGALEQMETQPQLCILPGTHSKHLFLQQGEVVSFKTYFTGEMFSLLTEHSILKNSIEAGGLLTDAEHHLAFLQGVEDAHTLNPLHAFFMVRTNALFETMTRTQNYHYLSGLLIGQELQHITPQAYPHIHLVVNNALSLPYTLALQCAGYPQVAFTNADDALLRGHYKVYCWYI